MELQWRKVKVLGAGSSGVHLASCYDQVMAVKSSNSNYASDAELVVIEGKILRHLAGAPNVVQCFGEDVSLEDNRRVYNLLLLEYAPLGALDDLIQRVGPMPELTVARYASMLLRGLAGIHSRGITHGDLRSDNILVFPDECGDDIGELKIADFGFSSWYYEAEERAVDVWSMGCTIFEMMTGTNAWDWERNWDLNHDNDLLQFNLSPNAVHFFNCCLNKDVVLRLSLSAGRLLEHPFIVDNPRLIDQTITHKVPIHPWISTTHMFSDRTVVGTYYQPQHSASSIDMCRLPIC